jgi:bacterioferritin-associated ferredoxin
MRLACRCMGFSSRRVTELAREHGCTDVESLGLATGAGDGCGTCRPELEELLADLRGEPVSEAARRANRDRNACEALRRVESALFVNVLPRLPAGTQVELLEMDGLRVLLQLGKANDTETLRALIAERLAKLVCAELEVRFSGSR